MEMMDYTKTQNSDFCGWSDDGKSIVIQNPREFVRHVVPRFFKGSTKFSSFQRKLYRWGFLRVADFRKRTSSGEEVISYQAANFQRGRMDLIKRMRSITAATWRKPKNGWEPKAQEISPFRKQASTGTADIHSSRASTCKALVSSFPTSEKVVLSPALTKLAQSAEGEGAASSPSASEGNNKTLDDRVISFPALDNVLLNDDATIASLALLYDIEPNPVH
jgi:hypothetical protein